MSASPALPEILQDLVSTLFRKIEVEKHDGRTRRVVVRVRRIDELDGRSAIAHNVDFGIHLGAGERFSYHEHIGLAVFGEKDVRPAGGCLTAGE
jgi:hypothetical protein